MDADRQRLYWIWWAMCARCTSPNDPAYPNYGGRGITVCDRWQEFENFLADMGLRPDGKSLDRIDNDGNYEPTNCRWASRKEQNGNRRNCIMVTFQGGTMNLKEASRQSGLKYRAVHKRLERGWDVARALSTPIGKGNAKCA